VGLGFVPNAASLSVVRDTNNVENVMRSWGGNELLMDDTDGAKYIKLTTPEARYIELHDGDRLVRVKSEYCEMLFSDEKQYALIDANGHKIRFDYVEDGNKISITTVKGAIINMDDEEDIITLQTAAEKDGKKTNLVVINGKDESITVDSKDNAGVFNGKEARITLESKNSKVAIDGNEEKIIMENKENKVIINGGDDSITVDAKKNINLKAGGKVVIDAKEGVSNKGQTIKLNK
jgi:uncharacterized protein (DUF2345 family)